MQNNSRNYIIGNINVKLRPLSDFLILLNALIIKSLDMQKCLIYILILFVLHNLLLLNSNKNVCVIKFCCKFIKFRCKIIKL